LENDQKKPGAQKGEKGEVRHGAAERAISTFLYKKKKTHQKGENEHALEKKKIPGKGNAVGRDHLRTGRSLETVP